MTPQDRHLGLAPALGAAMYLMGEWGMKSPACAVAGAIRRQEPDVREIELLAPLPGATQPDPLHEALARCFPAGRECRREQAEPGSLRGRVIRGLFPGFRGCDLLVNLRRVSTGCWHEMPVHIHRYTAENRGWIELLRTGPRDIGMIVQDRWRKVHRLRGQAPASRNGHLVDAKDEIVPVPTEAELFRLLGVPFVPPERRGAWAASIMLARRIKGEHMGRSS